MPFQVTLDGQKFRTDDLTLNECIQVESDADTNWALINPFRSAVDAKAVIVAFMSRSLGRDGALERVGNMSLKAVLEHLDVVEDDRPDSFEEGLPDPKEPSTATS